MTDTLEILLDDDEDAGDEPQITGFGPTGHPLAPLSQLSPSKSNVSVKQAKVTPFSHRPPIINDIPHHSRFPPSSVDPASVNPNSSYSSGAPAFLTPFPSANATTSSFASPIPYQSSSLSKSTSSRERPKALLPFQRFNQPTSKRTVAKKSTGRPTPTASASAIYVPSASVEIEACSVCGDHFAQSDISAHQSIHPQCGYCGQRFPTLKAIKDHIVAVHGSVSGSEDQNYHVIEVEDYVEGEGEGQGEIWDDDQQVGTEAGVWEEQNGVAEGAFWEDPSSNSEEQYIEEDQSYDPIVGGEEENPNDVEKEDDAEDAGVMIAADDDVMVDETVIDDDEEGGEDLTISLTGGNRPVVVLHDSSTKEKQPQIQESAQPLVSKSPEKNPSKIVSMSQSPDVHSDEKLKKSKSVTRQRKVSSDGTALLRTCRARLSQKFWCNGCNQKKRCLFRDIKVTEYHVEDKNDQNSESDSKTEMDTAAAKPGTKPGTKIHKRPHPSGNSGKSVDNEPTTTETLTSPSQPKKKYKASRLAIKKCTVEKVVDPLSHTKAKSVAKELPVEEEASKIKTIPLIKQEIEEICLSSESEEENGARDDLEKEVKDNSKKIIKKSNNLNQNSALLKMIQEVVNQQHMNMSVMQNLIMNQREQVGINSLSQVDALGGLSADSLLNHPLMGMSALSPSASTLQGSTPLINSPPMDQPIPLESFASSDTPLDPDSCPESVLDTSGSTVSAEIDSLPTNSGVTTEVDGDVLNQSSTFPNTLQIAEEENSQQHQAKGPSLEQSFADTNLTQVSGNKSGSVRGGGRFKRKPKRSTEQSEHVKKNSLADKAVEVDSGNAAREATTEDSKAVSMSVTSNNAQISEGFQNVGSLSGAKLQLVLADGKVVDVEPHEHVPLKILGANSFVPPAPSVDTGGAAVKTGDPPSFSKVEKDETKVSEEEKDKRNKNKQKIIEGNDANQSKPVTTDDLQKKDRKCVSQNESTDSSHLRMPEPDKFGQMPPGYLFCRKKFGKSSRNWCQACRVKKIPCQKWDESEMKRKDAENDLKSSPLISLKKKPSNKTLISCRLKYGKEKKKKWCRSCRLKKSPCEKFKIDLSPKVKRPDPEPDPKPEPKITRSSVTSREEAPPSMYDKIKTKAASRTNESFDLKDREIKVKEGDKDSKVCETRSKRDSIKDSQVIEAKAKEGNNDSKVDEVKSKRDGEKESKVDEKKAKKDGGRATIENETEVCMARDDDIEKTRGRGRRTKRANEDKKLEGSSKERRSSADTKSGEKTCLTRYPDQATMWCWYCQRKIPGCNANLTFNCKRHIPTQYASWCENCKQKRGSCLRLKTGVSGCRKRHASYKDWCYDCKAHQKQSGVYNPDNYDKKCADHKPYKYWCYQCKSKLGTCFYVDGPRPTSPNKSPTSGKVKASPKGLRNRSIDASDTGKSCLPDDDKTESPPKAPDIHKNVKSPTAATESIKTTTKSAKSSREKGAIPSSKFYGAAPEVPGRKSRVSSRKKVVAKKSTGSRRRDLDEAFFGLTDSDVLASGFDVDDSSSMLASGNAFAIDSFVMKFEKKNPGPNKKNETDLPWNLDCSECGMPMDGDAHFQRKLRKCEKNVDARGEIVSFKTRKVCEFASHCRAAFEDHVEHFHGGKLYTEERAGEDGVLECASCNFVAELPDKMSVHLAKHEHGMCRLPGSAGRIVIDNITSIGGPLAQFQSAMRNGDGHQPSKDTLRVMKQEVIESDPRMSYQDSTLSRDEDEEVEEEEEEEEEDEEEDGDEGQDYPDSGTIDNLFMAKVDAVFSKAKEPLRVKKELQ